MGADLALVTELEDALKNGAPEKRAAILRRVTSLFVNDADRLNEQQVAVFDDVLVHLAQRIESRALVELSTTLAPIANAPVAMVRRLANDDQIIVAGPVLSQSSRLTDDDLIDVAKSKGQAHLLAISGRTTLTETVTDVLLERGDQRVTHTLAENAGAAFSELGFASIIKKSTQDGSLVESSLSGWIYRCGCFESCCPARLIWFVHDYYLLLLRKSVSKFSAR